jgi:sugar phosphate isomerase/epimerase
MRLAFSKPTASEADQRLLFSRFREFGYEGLQLKAGQYERYLERPGDFLGEWGEAPDLERGIAALRKLFAFGRAVGSERVVFCHGAPHEGISPSDLRRYARILSDLGEEAADHSLKLSLHHHYNQPVMRREEFHEFFGAARPGAVGLTLDTAHLVKSGEEEIAGIVREFAPFLDNVHLKDFADGEFRVLGEGRIAFGPVFAALREIGYDGWLCADEESGSDLIGAMETCQRTILSL